MKPQLVCMMSFRKTLIRPIFMIPGVSHLGTFNETQKSWTESQTRSHTRYTCVGYLLILFIL